MGIKFSKYELLLLITSVVLWIIFRLSGLDGTTGQDSYAYTQYAVSLQRWLSNGIKPEAFFWPVGYPLAAAILSFGFLPASIILQFISSISLGVSLVYLNRILTKRTAEDNNSKSSFIYLLIWGFLAPYVFRNSLTNTSDMLAFCMIAGALYHYFKYLDKTSFRDLFLATVFISYGIFTRYINLLVFFPIGLHLIWHWIRNHPKPMQLVVVVFPTTLLALNIFLSDISSGFISHPFLAHWEFSNFFSSEFASPEGQLIYFFPNIVFTFYPFFHPGFCIPGFLFLTGSFYKSQFQNKQLLALIISSILFSIFIGGNYSQNPRHLLAIYPIVLVLCYNGYIHIYKWLSPKPIGKFIWIGLLFLQVVLSARALYPTINRNKLEKVIASEILSFTKDSNTILYSFDIDIALKYRQPKIKIISLYYTIISSYEPGSLALINESKWSNQWHGKNPMINIQNLKNTFPLRKLKSYSGGWDLYLIADEAKK